MIDSPLLNRFLGYIKETTQLSLTETHWPKIVQTIEDIARSRHVSPEKLLHSLRSDTETAELFIDRILVKETYFFRDEAQFTSAFNLIRERARSGSPLSIWCANCSSGEEALSFLAFIVSMERESGKPLRLKLLASDMNRSGLDILRAGRYDHRSLRADGNRYHPLLDSIRDLNSPGLVFKREYLDRISIEHIALPAPEAKPKDFDIIFFRNALIYMAETEKEKTMTSLVSALKPGGSVFLASPEIPTIKHPELALVDEAGTFHFKKTAVPVHEKALPARKTPGTSAAPGSRKETPPNIKPEASRKNNSAGSGHPLDKSRAILDCLATVRRGEIEASYAAIRKLEESIGPGAETCYLRGLAEDLHLRTDLAHAWWEQSLSFSRDFWPASYQLLTRNLADKDTTDARSVSTCITRIRTHPESQPWLFGDLDHHDLILALENLKRGNGKGAS